MHDAGERLSMPVTPIQARVAALVADELGDRPEVDIVQRSPLGPHALRIDDRACQTHDIADWAGRQPWVDGVAERPRHVYLRIDVEVLVRWVCEGFAVPGAPWAHQGTGRWAVLRCPPAANNDGQSLDARRVVTTAHALGALLRASGYEVAEHEEGGVAANALVAVLDGATRALTVGGVDVRHGALRARHDGSVGVAELINELQYGSGCAHERLAFALLRTPRARRADLDEARLFRSARELDAMCAACRAPERLPETGPPSVAALRALAGELDTVGQVIARALAAMDPAIVLRRARSLTARLPDGAHDPWGDALTATARGVVGALLQMSAIEGERVGDPGDSIVL
jgi:hypothetical protein